MTKRFVFFYENLVKSGCFGREIMIKNLSFIIALILLNGCVESVALLGPVTTGAGSQKIAQSAISSSLSYGIKNFPRTGS